LRIFIRNPLVFKMLDRAVKNERLHHALLFHGPSGVGKFTSAIALIKQLNCQQNVFGGCGDCSFCRRVQLPFPYHPDVTILRNVHSPIVICQNDFLQEYLFGNKTRAGKKNIQKEYLDFLESMKDEGYINRLIHCKESTIPTDIIFCRKERFKSISGQETERTTSLTRWIFKKISMYIIASTYQETIKIDQIRNIQKILSYRSFEAPKKVVVIDEAEHLTVPAQNCLLKTLEEPPDHSYIIMVTSNPSALLPTIRSRCQAIPFRRLPDNLLTQILTEKFGFSQENAQEISKISEGKVINALLKNRLDISNQHKIFSELFVSSESESHSDWAIRCADTIMQQSKSSDRKDYYEVLNDLYSWFHQKMCDWVSGNSIQQKKYMLPGNNRLELDDIFVLMEGLTKLFDVRQFHVDLKLQLEAVFLKVGNCNIGCSG